MDNDLEIITPTTPPSGVNRRRFLTAAGAAGVGFAGLSLAVPSVASADVAGALVVERLALSPV